MSKKVLLFIGFFLLTSLSMLSQDVMFSQFNNNRNYLNPAFVGSKECPTLTMSYRNQWPALRRQYVTSMLTYDQHFKRSRNAFGVILINDQQGNGSYSLNSGSLLFSNCQKLTRKSCLKFGMEMSYRQRFLDWSNLTFEDSFDGTEFIPGSTSEILSYSGKIHYFDIGGGLLYVNENFYLGVSGHHLNSPNESLLFGESPTYRRYTVNAGGMINLSKNNYNRQPVTMSPNIVYSVQGQAQQITLLTTINKGMFIGGAGIRGVIGNDYTDSVILNLGVGNEDYAFSYTYDLTTSKLNPSIGGANEISLVIKVKCYDRPPKITPIPCHSFN